MSIFPSAPGATSLRDIFLRLPDQALGLIDFYQALMRGPSPLSAAERETIYSYLSLQSGCHFCHTSHGHCAVSLGAPRAVFGVPPERLLNAPISLQLRSALMFGVALIRGERCQGSGLKPDVIRDTVLVTGLTAFINRVIEGLDAEAPDEIHRRNGEGLAQNGYLTVRTEVERSFAREQMQPSQSISDRPLSNDLLAWTKDYAKLVLTGRSGLPARLRSSLGTEGFVGTVPEQAAWQLGHNLFLKPTRTTMALVAPLYAAGYSERDIVDLVMAAAVLAMQKVLLIGGVLDG